MIMAITPSSSSCLPTYHHHHQAATSSNGKEGPLSFFTIRTATPQDIEEVADIIYHAFDRSNRILG